VGILATCGLIALEDWKEKLKIDNDNAKWVGELMKDIPNVSVHDLKTIETNIMRFSLHP